MGIERDVYNALNSFTFTFAGGRKERGEGKGGWVAERVMEFVKDLMPFVKVESKGTGMGTNKSAGMGMTLVAGKGATAGRRGGGRDSSAAGGGGAGEGTGTKYVIPTLNERIEDLSERFQAFYERLEEDLYAFFGRGGVSNSNSNSGLGLGGDGNWKAGNEGEEERERKVREVMELVEKVVCELFYDRCVFSYLSYLLIPHIICVISLLRAYNADSTFNQPRTTQRTTKCFPAASQR